MTKVITRREMNCALTLTLSALFSQGPATLLHAEGLSAQQNAQGPMQNMASLGVQTLMQEPLAEMSNPEVTMITLTVAPGSNSRPHRHTGPVFAYLLEGEIENQVEPEPPRRYKAGQFFYEPPMHVHRMLRNLSATKAAKLLIVEVGEKGKPFTIGAS
jgi:quercetin dioxygenase-like cupin family protein